MSADSAAWSARLRLDRVGSAKVIARMMRHVSERMGRDLFSSPALDMMLDLYVRSEHRPISLTSLTGATPAPQRTALFTINRLVERKLLARHRDPRDGRRINVELSAAGLRLLEECVEEMIGIMAGQ